MSREPASNPSHLRVMSERAEMSDTEERLLPTLDLAFSPLHKAAFGTATGVAGSLFVSLLTVGAIVSPEARAFPLGLLAQYFAGYSVTWGGVLVGAVWGFSVSFVAGWFVAFCRNLALAIVSFTYRTRAELTQTREFLDHI